MASRGTSKWHSLRQEQRFAKLYDGTVSPSSGAHITDQGDVRTRDYLMECKMTGIEKPAKSISVKLADLEKIADEAWREGRTPLMGLTIRNPGSVLADSEGNIDLVVMFADDHAEETRDEPDG